MKHLLLFLSAILCALSLNAQKVQVSTDDFTGATIAETSWEKIYTGGMTGKDQTRMMVQDNAGSTFFKFRVFTDAVLSIQEGANVMFKTSGGVINCTVVKYALAEPGAWTVNAPNNKLGIYFTVSADLNAFNGVEIQKIRFPFSDGNLDLDINSKSSNKIIKMIQLVKDAVQQK